MLLLQFSVLCGTLSENLRGTSVHGSKLGPRSKLSYEFETKLVDYTSQRAQIGIGFGKKQLLRYASGLGRKYQVKFKNKNPSDRCWRSFKLRHQKLVLRKPEGTSTVRHQCQL